MNVNIHDIILALMCVSVLLNIVQAIAWAYQHAQETYITVQEAANRYKVHHKTLVRLARTGQVDYLRVGRQYRYSAQHLDKYFKSHPPMPVAVRPMVGKNAESSLPGQTNLPLQPKPKQAETSTKNPTL